MKIIISKILGKKMAKVAGLWDSIKNVGQKATNFYDKARTGWEIGKFDPKPRWQQRMDAMTTQHGQYVDPKGNANYYKSRDGQVRKVVKDKQGNLDMTKMQDAPLDENGKIIPYNPYYQENLSKGLGHQQYTGQYGGNIFGRGRRMPIGKQVHPKLVNRRDIQDAVQKALEELSQGKGDAFQRLENQGIIIDEVVAQPTQQNAQVPGQVPGQVPAATTTQNVQTGVQGTQIPTSTGTITGPVV